MKIENKCQYFVKLTIIVWFFFLCDKGSILSDMNEGD